MRVAVTGASGFIGPHLCRRLTEQEHHQVIGISRSAPASGRSIQAVNCDITSEEQTLAAFEKMGQVDCVFHLAGQTFSRTPLTPQDYFRSNVSGTLNVLECCRLYDIKKLVFSSSIAVYGLSAGQYLPKYLPVDEGHEARPYEFYDASKYHAEQLCKHYHDRFGISCAVLRYSRVYGPGLENGVVYQTIQKSLAGQPVEVLGDISTDFVYVDDVVQANALALYAPLNFRILNIGSGEQVTLHQLCSTIVRLTNSRSEIKYRTEPKGRFWLDISLARQVLGYSPTALEEGLIKSIQYIRGSPR